LGEGRARQSDDAVSDVKLLRFARNDGVGSSLRGANRRRSNLGGGTGGILR
jgi:hypothetical protein